MYLHFLNTPKIVVNYVVAMWPGKMGFSTMNKILIKDFAWTSGQAHTPRKLGEKTLWPG